MNQVEKINYLKKVFKNIANFSNSTFVIYCSGKILDNSELLNAFAEDIAFLQNSAVNVIIIADGSQSAKELLQFFTQQQVSDLNLLPKISNVELLEMISVGLVNQRIVSAINLAGGNAHSISGKDTQFMIAKRSKIACFDQGSDEKILNIGYMGELSMVNPDILLIMEESNIISVISPIALGDDGRTYKLDALDIATAIAAVMSATQLVFLSDQQLGSNNSHDALSKITINDATKSSQELGIEQNLFKAAMIALDQGIENIMVLDGQKEHALLLAIIDENTNGISIKAE